MEIEYIYAARNDDKQRKHLEKQNTLGCLVSLLFLLVGLFIFLALLPLLLVVLGYAILFLGIYTIYKAFLEDFVLNLIKKLKSR